MQHEIHALALQALAYAQMGKRTLATEALGRATMLGEPGRFNRTFTGEDSAIMKRLLEELSNSAQNTNGLAEIASPSYLTYLLRQMSDSADSAQTKSTAGLVESLTARESEILRLITAGMRNQEIADHLFISLHTVKRHIANVYSKMNVSHRTEAVARARELNLL